MERASRGRRRRGASLPLAIAFASVLCVLPSATGAVGGSTVVIDAAPVATVFTGHLGVKQPVGLAYMPETGVLLVAKTTPKRTRVLRFAGLRTSLAAISLPKVSRPWTLSYDAGGGGLVAISGQRELVRVPPSELHTTHRPKAVTRDLGPLLRDPQGAAFDASTRTWLVLDRGAHALVAVAGPGGAPLRPRRIPLSGVAGRTLRGLAFNPTDRLLYTADVARGLVYAVDARGRLRKTYSIRNAALEHLTGLVFARTSNTRDSRRALDLYAVDAGSPTMLARLVEFSLPARPAPQRTVIAVLEATINSSKFQPPSPDTSGIVYVPSDDSLLVVDSEVDETHYFKGVNVWRVRRSGTLLGTGSTMQTSAEPTGVGFDPRTGALFISDDDRHMVDRHLPGPDGHLGTNDDVVTSFKTVPFGSHDPEDVCVDTRTGHLYVADGTGAKIIDIDPVNGVFGDGDDKGRTIGLSRFGFRNVEAVGYDARSDTLVVGDLATRRLLEITKDGTLLRDISLSAITPNITPSGVTFAPRAGSGRGGGLSYWIVDRGADNNQNPGENDGRIYEIRVP